MCSSDLIPRPGLRRHTEIRDRTCTHPCCRRPAHACHQDHTLAWAEGGATTRANIGPACPHDHTVKHAGGWSLEQPEPGRFIWHSPLGGAYPSRGQFLHPPLPPATPDTHQHHDDRDNHHDDRDNDHDHDDRDNDQHDSDDTRAGPTPRYDEGPILPRDPDRSARWRAPPDPSDGDAPPF